LSALRKNALLISILVSILIGFGLGAILKVYLDDSNRDIALWFTLPGKLFIRALELLIVPVVFVGVTTATSSLSPKNNLRITLICFGLVLLTHVAATLVGLAGSLVLNVTSELQKPDKTSDTELAKKQKDAYDIVADILRNIIPKNIIKATTDQEITRYVSETDANGTVTYSRKVEYIDGSNILGILTFAILLGLASSVLEEKASLFREFFKSCNDVVIQVLRWLILFAPVGIASLIVDAVLDVSDLEESFKQIGLFTGLCVAALVVYGFGVLSLIIFVFTRQNPFKYYVYFVQPALLAFASTSGAVCIHESLEVCDKKIKMDPRLSKFTIPFYTALQADGQLYALLLSFNFVAAFISSNSFGSIEIQTQSQTPKKRGSIPL
jgi:Na+/H+-dicarboxylate symporter